MLVTNYVVDTNGIATYSPITNIVNVNLHTLMLDGAALLTQVPVSVFALVTHSTNVVVSDAMNLVQSFYIDGQSFTLNGSITLTSFSYVNVLGQGFTTGLNNWVYTNAPYLLYFTNNGTLTVPSETHFGDDRPTPYSTFINTGTINAGSIQFNSAYFENSGTLATTTGPLTMLGGSGKLENGQSSSVNDANFVCGTLKFDNYTLNSSGGGVNFTVTNALFDGGAGSGSKLTMLNGFNLWVKPTTGDLIGTTFQTRAPNYAEVDHDWAGDDRGAIAAGYTNNVAIGTLTLGPVGSGGPLLYFEGTAAHNGLYVDLLDLSNISSTSNQLFTLFDIDPSLVIYYAAAKIGFTPPNSSGVAQQPEEYLDGQFGGHLRWVSSFAGPNSSVTVLVNGVPVQKNKALRLSKIIDSNGNGIPNFYDSAPFDTPPLTLTASVVKTNQPPAAALALSWNAAPHTSYQVQFSTNLALNSWLTLLNYTNNLTASQTVTVYDTNAPAAGGPCRFYRVSYTP